jgi:hypothetical protein
MKGDLAELAKSTLPTITALLAFDTSLQNRKNIRNCATDRRY